MQTWGVPADAPPLAGPAIFDQRWTDLAFLHWPVDPAGVARWMPRHVRPDVADGVTYVGLVPFAMRAAGLGVDHPVPWLGSFGEVNVRLYSVDDAGRHGVVFRSLDCSRLAVVLAARAVGVPYVWSRVETGGGRWTVRRRASPTRSVLAMTVGDPVEPTPLEVFLTARWGMHAQRLGVPYWVPNEHGRWPLHAATVTGLDDELVAAAGIEPVGPMLRPLWSPGVHSRFGPPTRVRGTLAR